MESALQMGAAVIFFYCERTSNERKSIQCRITGLHYQNRDGWFPPLLITREAAIKLAPAPSQWAGKWGRQM